MWRHYALDDANGPQLSLKLPVMGRNVWSQALDFTCRGLQSSPTPQHIIEAGIQSWHWTRAGTNTPDSREVTGNPALLG